MSIVLERNFPIRFGLTQKIHFDSGVVTDTECRLAIRTCVVSEAGLRAQLSVSTGLNGAAERIGNCNDAAVYPKQHWHSACNPHWHAAPSAVHEVLIDKRTRCFDDGHCSLFSSPVGAWTLGCGGGGAGSVPQPTPPPPSIQVEVSPQSGTVLLGETLRLTATVSSSSTNNGGTQSFRVGVEQRTSGQSCSLERVRLILPILVRLDRQQRQLHRTVHFAESTAGDARGHPGQKKLREDSRRCWSRDSLNGGRHQPAASIEQPWTEGCEEDRPSFFNWLRRRVSERGV
jgi:hypothetical protein